MISLLDLPGWLPEVVQLLAQTKELLPLFQACHATRTAVLQAAKSLTIEHQAGSKASLIPNLALVEGVRYTILKLAASKYAPTALVRYIPALLSGQTKELELKVRGCRASS